VLEAINERLTRRAVEPHHRSAADRGRTACGLAQIGTIVSPAPIGWVAAGHDGYRNRVGSRSRVPGLFETADAILIWRRKSMGDAIVAGQGRRQPPQPPSRIQIRLPHRRPCGDRHRGVESAQAENSIETINSGARALVTERASPGRRSARSRSPQGQLQEMPGMPGRAGVENKPLKAVLPYYVIVAFAWACAAA